jgi:hypothetical protein
MLASWLFVAIGQPGLRINYETIGYLVGPLTFGELVRGHVRHWLGYYPAEYCFPAIAAGGLSAGALFGGFMMLRWAELTWVEPIIWGALGAALYLLVGWLMRLDERKKSRSVR